MKYTKLLLLATLLVPFAVEADQCPNPLSTVPLQNFPCADKWLVSLFEEVDCPIAVLPINANMTRRMRLLLDGQVQVLLGLSRTLEREQYFRFSAPIASHKLVLYGKKGSLVSQNIQHWCDDTMRSAKLILPPRGHFGPNVDALKKGNECAAQLIYAPQGSEQASKMLIAGRGDLIIGSDHWLDEQTSEIKNAIERLDILVWEENTELAFKGLDENFIHRVNEVIEARALAGNTPCGLAPTPNEVTQTQN